jgi:erythromycin esterase-like protein
MRRFAEGTQPEMIIARILYWRWRSGQVRRLVARWLIGSRQGRHAPPP